MRIFMDADACPRAIKEILFRAVARVNVPLVMVYNLKLKIPETPNISVIDVPGGLDEADDKIVELAAPGDLVVTADIPLADRVVSRGAVALNPRGTFYTPETIKDRLAVRNLMDQLRGQGANIGGPPVFNHQDRRAFANELDKFLAKHGKTLG
ncbi:MAG: YaiI/YqxD family protein [Candidatus Firestonebacteria bacterium]|nr:YaiI/YqxD family protein [Candidatus Firestonebacteria bacterium]